MVAGERFHRALKDSIKRFLFCVYFVGFNLGIILILFFLPYRFKLTGFAGFVLAGILVLAIIFLSIWDAHNPFPPSLNRKRIPIVIGGYVIAVAGLCYGVVTNNSFILLITSYIAFMVVITADNRAFSAFSKEIERDFRIRSGISSDRTLTLEELETLEQEVPAAASKRYKQVVKKMKKQALEKRNLRESLKRLPLQVFGYFFLLFALYEIIFLVLYVVKPENNTMNVPFVIVKALIWSIVGVCLLFFSLYYFPEDGGKSERA